MRFTFLGTGTSAGIPTIGCDCAVCHSDDPRDTRLRCSALIEFTDYEGQDRAILIDAGPDLRQQALASNMQRLDAVLFTHNHVDHTFGLDEVRRFNAIMDRSIMGYAEPHTMEHLQRVYKHIFDRASNVNDSFVATIVPAPLRANDPISLYGLTITPIRMLHGNLPILAFRIEPSETQRPLTTRHTRDADQWWPLVYATDVSAIPSESWIHLEHTRTLVIDGLRHRKHATHMTVDQAVSVSEQLGPLQTYLIHMSHDIAHAETDAALPQGINLAHDGLVLDARPIDHEQA